MKFFMSALVMLVMAAAGYAADVDGTWTGIVQGPLGDVPVTFKFMADGTKLTGSTTGLDGSEIQIMDGKVDGETITFTVTFDITGMPFTLSYKGLVSADQIKISSDVFGTTVEFVLKKAKA